ncbi:RNA polymerase sigma-70 factor (ECF subfamily) [Phycicoccus badiiscoriae]|uniref:RNA polymerase sigma-70 factor (ECF subfamily) n=1 Tax=Pedococcus badiiscoriae TaxID=642776 RepID=A0A852WBJ4_9MICO|nr:sigma-70 family RNA polymerase sigma factor [Pedococcus badiiscoriae]NYG06483.1 RNA polymerase sigma-70 factor (ECF subfamily) [Pedococcus badiiscoriae]
MGYAGAGDHGHHGLGPATADFLSSLRVALSIVGEAGTLSDGHGGRGDQGGSGGSAARAGFGPGEAPQDFERISALVELAQRGDGEAFGMLYERYVDVVYRYVYVRVGSKQLAEDITSETFLRALRRMDSFSWQGRDIAAWFITIARNLITDNAKSARFRMEVTTADMLDADRRVDAPDQEVLDRLRDQRLLAAVKGLKPEQAECVVLRFLQGLSLAETAKVLGKSEGAVKQLQLRAVRALHRELADVDI